MPGYTLLRYYQTPEEQSEINKLRQKRADLKRKIEQLDLEIEVGFLLKIHEASVKGF